jgi:VWFA-related protein
MPYTLHRCALVLLLSLSVCVAALPVRGAKDDDKKPKREKFGSSLKRLRWDKEKQAAVEKPDKSASKKPKVDPKANNANSNADVAVQLKTLLVTFDVLVTDSTHQHTIEGLTKDDFIVTEDNQPQLVSTFARGDDVSVPRSIILLMDWSRSQKPFIETSVRAAKVLVSQLGPADEMAIITDDVDLVCDYTNDKTKLAAALDVIEKRANDPLRRSRSWQFTALFAALRELISEEQRRPIIIFQTDGDQAVSFRDQPMAEKYNFMQGGDPPEDYSLNDIFAAARKSRATIYSVMTNERLVGLTESQLYQRGGEILRQWWHSSINPDDPHDAYRVKLYTDMFLEGQKAAARVAMTTGGWMAFLEKPEQAEGIYGTILKDINQRYIIGYYPTNTARDGKPRKVKITVRNHPDYYVHGRNTYYAPDQP